MFFIVDSDVDETSKLLLRGAIRQQNVYFTTEITAAIGCS